MTEESVPKVGRPPKLYRFRPFNQSFAAEELDRALAGEIFVPKASTLNDPFDLKPVLIIPTALEAKQSLKAAFGNRPTLSRKAMSMYAGRELSRLEFRRNKTHFVPSLEYAKVELRTFREVVGSTHERYCVACLSERASSPLMWAHYSANHAGICICYSFTPDFTAGVEMRPIQVTYQRDRPSVTFDDVLRFGQRGKTRLPIEEASKVLQALVLTKGEDWSYEREWRIVTSLEDGQRYRYCAHLRPDSILIGLRTSERDIGRVKEINRDRVPVLQSQPSQETFELSFVEV